MTGEDVAKRVRTFYDKESPHTIDPEEVVDCMNRALKKIALYCPILIEAESTIKAQVDESRYSVPADANGIKAITIKGVQVLYGDVWVPVPIYADDLFSNYKSSGSGLLPLCCRVFADHIEFDIEFSENATAANIKITFYKRANVVDTITEEVELPDYAEEIVNDYALSYFGLKFNDQRYATFERDYRNELERLPYISKTTKKRTRPDAGIRTTTYIIADL